MTKLYAVLRGINYEGEDIIFLTESLEKAKEVFNNPSEGDYHKIIEIELNRKYDINYFPREIERS